MPTDNYSLPTISGEEVIDIVGDMNALANATDAALKKVEQGGLDPYVLPTATRTVKGGVIVGDGLSITPGGVLSTVSQGGGGGTATLPVATSVTLGGVKIGAGITVTPDGTISVPASSSIEDGAVTSSKLASGAVTADKLSASAVTSVKIDNGAVTEGKIANGAVTSEKLGDSSVTAAKIADGSVTRAKLDASTQDAIAKIGNALTTDSAKAWVLKQIYSSNNVTVVHASNQALNLAYVKIYLDAYSATSTRFSVGTVPTEGRPGRNQYQYITRDATAGNASIEVIAASGAVSLLTDATGGTMYGGATLMYPIGM